MSRFDKIFSRNKKLLGLKIGKYFFEFEKNSNFTREKLLGNFTRILGVKLDLDK